MPTRTEPTPSPEWIRSVVREVVQRLAAGSPAGRHASVDRSAEAAPNAVAERPRLVTVGTIDAVPAGEAELVVAAGAVVTPAAVDEAKRRGIRLVQTSQAAASPGSPAPPATGLRIRDAQRPERAAQVIEQLTRRGLNGVPHDAIVLSDRPHETAHRETVAGSRVAIVRCYGDVDRFAAEWNPNTWILDLVDLNPAAVVNAAQRIVQRSRA